jgi:hypothetical protein
MNSQYEQLQKKLVLDPMELDQELIELPMLIMEANEQCAHCLSARDRAKNDLDLAMAEAADDLRSQTVSDGKGGFKVRSEAQITTEIALYKSVQEAQRVVESAKLDLALWQALCDSFRTKRDSLKIFSDLTISGYLSPNAALTQRRTEIRNAEPPRRRTINAQ